MAVSMWIVWIHCWIWMSARYWEDPHAFKPQRFLEDWPREAFLPFSAAARACLGRKWDRLRYPEHFQGAYSRIFFIIRFGETEGVALLTLFVSRYKITVKEEPQFAHETFKQRRDRILKSAQGITVTCVYIQRSSSQYLIPDDGLFYIAPFVSLWFSLAELEHCVVRYQLFIYLYITSLDVQDTLPIAVTWRFRSIVIKVV